MLSIAGIGGGLYMLNRGLRGAFRAFMEQEKAERALSAAVEGSIEQYKSYASEIQKLTVYGDELILSQMAYASNLGVTTDKLQEATTAAIGLAARYRIDLAAAMMLVGRASQGQTQMLTRYGIVIDQNLSTQEKFNELLKIGAESFRLAEEETKTLEGTWAQFANNMGDFAEDIVGAWLDVAKGLKAVVDHYKGVEKGAEKAHRKVKEAMPSFQTNMPGAFYYPPPKLTKPTVSAAPSIPKTDPWAAMSKRLDETNLATQKAANTVRSKYIPVLEREIQITGRIGEAHYHAAKMVDYENAIKKAGLEDTREGIRLMEDMRYKLKELEKAQRLARIADDIGSSFANAFEDMIFEAKKFDEVMRSVIRSIARSVMQNLIFQPMGLAISGAISGGLSGLFGGAAGATQSAFSSPHGGPALQYGGTVERTGWAKVHKGETYSGVGGGGNVVINIDNRGQPLSVIGYEQRDAEDQRIIDLVVDNAQGDGPVRRMVREVVADVE